MTKIKLTDNLSLSQIIRGFGDWILGNYQQTNFIDNMKSSIDLGVTSFWYSRDLCRYFMWISDRGSICQRPGIKGKSRADFKNRNLQTRN